MKLFKSPLRRAAAIIAGTVVGLAGVVAVASPSVAAPNLFAITLTGEGCNRPGGGWNVTWTVTNQTRFAGWIAVADIDLPRSGSTLTGLDVGTVVPAAGDAPLVGKQIIDNDNPVATIHVRVGWGDPADPTATTFPDIKTVTKPSRPGNRCATSSPSPSPSETSASPSPSPSETSESPSPSPSETSPSPSPSTTSASPSPSASTSTPPANESAGWFYDETCDTLTVGVDVPASWDDLTVTFTPSTGAAKTVTAPAGQETSVDFPASAGLTVTATAKDYPDSTAKISYQAPKDCDGGGLPVTGAAAGGIAAGAVALLAVGGFLFFLARRRKVKFTA